MSKTHYFVRYFHSQLGWTTYSVGNRSSRRKITPQEIDRRLRLVAEQVFGGTDCGIDTCRPHGAGSVTEFDPSGTTLFHSPYLSTSYIHAITLDSELGPFVENLLSPRAFVSHSQQNYASKARFRHRYASCAI
jgi:hypothetical protein